MQKKKIFFVKYILDKDKYYILNEEKDEEKFIDKIYKLYEEHNLILFDEIEKFKSFNNDLCYNLKDVYIDEELTNEEKINCLSNYLFNVYHFIKENYNL